MLRERGPLSQAGLVRHAGLARPTVAAIVADLRRRGVLVELGPDRTTTGGRPGALLTLDPRCATAAVVRVLPTIIDVWLVDSEGRNLGSGQIANPGDTDRCLEALAAELDRLAADVGVSRPRSIGMLLVGRVDPVTSVCDPSALGPTAVAIAAVEDRLQAAVTVLNPAAAAALGVARAGRHTDAVVVFLDHGIGVGIVCGGQVLRGAGGGAGELGHCPLPGRTARCHCGRTGCLETVAAGWFLAERAAAILGPAQQVPATLAGLEALGHRSIDRLLADAAHQLGLAVGWLVNTLDPGTVLLGGTPFAAGAETFLAAFADSVRQHAIAVNAAGLVIDVARPTADLDGATHAALDRIEIG